MCDCDGHSRPAVLDEATSALDAESEHLVVQALDRLMAGRTALVIAHRLSTVKSAACVCVLGDGVVAESGTHAELLAREGVYHALVQRQLTGNDGGDKGSGVLVNDDAGAGAAPAAVPEQPAPALLI